MRLRSVEQGRILGFDLESAPAAFWVPDRPSATITAFGWKWLDEHDVCSMLRCADGRWLCDDGKRIGAGKAFTRFADLLASASLVFGHNIRAFDLPLVNAGLMRLHLPGLRSVMTTDTLKDYPKVRDMSKSLENLVKMLRLDDEGGKLHMSVIDWEKANELTPVGVELARARVASDVLLQERLRAKLLELGLLKTPRRWAP